MATAAQGTGTDRGAGLAEIELALTRLVRRLNQPRIHERFTARAGVVLDRAAYAAIGRVAECGPLRLSELAARMGVDASTACRQVQQLERAGLVGRVGDPSDGRATLLRLTAEGDRVLGRLRAARRSGLAELFAAWSEADRRALATLLGRMVDDLETMTEER